MAAVVERNNAFCVVYSVTDENGKKKQKWETYHSKAEAEKRKKEIEYKQNICIETLPNCSTLTELLDEYVALYGKARWSLSVYSSNKALIKNYIIPFIGKLKLHEISARILERYYQKLLQTPSVARATDSPFKDNNRLVGTSTVRDVHKLLRSAFAQAMKWDLIEKNPAALVDVPKHEARKRAIWDFEALSRANEVCPDARLKLCINLSFACSLRIGELLGLTWNCVDISEESMKNDRASIYINKELQRVSKEALVALDNKDVIALFPEASINAKSTLVLKSPKTLSSVRKVFLPHTVADMLLRWKKDQDEIKKALGDEYHDYDLVISSPCGTPVEETRIQQHFRRFIEEYDLPPVVFHSLRHSSITYKLKLTGGDIKAVQGDSGHAQAKMVTDQYSHILEDSRKENAHLLEKAFYQKKNPGTSNNQEESDNTDSEQQPSERISKEKLEKLLQNDAVISLLEKLAAVVETEGVS